MKHFVIRRRMACRTLLFLGALAAIGGGAAFANPYLAKSGDTPIKVRIGACAITGGFIHLYAALDNRLFDKYGIQAEHIVVRGGAVAAAGLGSDEINFLYCNADASIVRIGAGADGKLVASPLIGLPYVVLARKDIKRPDDLKGKRIGVTRPGDFPYRLAKEFLKKHNLSENEVTLATVGGSPTERYTALTQDIFQATLIQPPLDARGKKDGFNVIYNLNHLGLPFIYSSLFTNTKTWKERPAVVQKAVAALAESVYFVEKKPGAGDGFRGQDIATEGRRYPARGLRCLRQEPHQPEPDHPGKDGRGNSRKRPSRGDGDPAQTERSIRQHLCRKPGQIRFHERTLGRPGAGESETALRNSRAAGE